MIEDEFRQTLGAGSLPQVSTKALEFERQILLEPRPDKPWSGAEPAQQKLFNDLT